MEGYTSHIILAAPLKWWPSLRELYSYPLHPARSFMASCTEMEMPLPSQYNVRTKLKKEEKENIDGNINSNKLHGSSHKEEEQEEWEELQNNVCNCNRSVGLSRLGRSLFALAELVEIENEYNLNVSHVLHENSNNNNNNNNNNNQTQWAVKVFNPFSQKLLYLDVCYVPLHIKLNNDYLSHVITANKTNNDILEWYDLIRIIPEGLHKQNNISTHSSNNINTLLFAKPAGVLWSKINRSLLCNVENEEQHFLYEYKKEIEDDNDTKSSNNEKGNCYATSVFIDGDTDVCVSFCHALLAYAQYNLPLTQSISNETTNKLSKVNTEHVCQVRHLNFSVLCRLDEREVLHNIHAAFTPILVEKYNNVDDNNINNIVIIVQPIVFIILQGIELLTSSYASENNNVLLMASVICYALCNQIDNITLNSKQHDNNNKYVILTLCHTQHGFISARELNKQLSPSLASRLLRNNFYLPRGPCVEDLSRWFEIKYNKSNKTTTNKTIKVNKMYEHYTFTEWLSVNVDSLTCIVQKVQTENAASHNNGDIGDMETRKEEGNVYAHLFGLDEVIQTVEQLLIWPLQHLSVLQNLQIDLPRGLLLCGSAGTGKTSLMKALANRLTLINNNNDNNNNNNLYINVMMIDALSLLTKEVGSSEKNIARLFAQARKPFTFHDITNDNKANSEFTNTNTNTNTNINNINSKYVVSVLFTDNLDSLAPPRQREGESGSGSSSSTTTDRTLSTLLMEMDGVASQRFYYYNKKNSNENNCEVNNNGIEEMSNVPVMIIAAAPSIASLDPAIIRPGRLDIHCNLPSSHSFEFMSKIITNQILQFVNKMNVTITDNTTINPYDNHTSAVIVEKGDKDDKSENENVNNAELEKCILQQLQEQTQDVKELSAAQYMAVLRDVFIELLAKVSASVIKLSSTTEQIEDDTVKHSLELNELVQLLQHALSKV